MKPEEQTSLYERMHAEWMQNPMTKVVVKAIDNHANKHTIKLAQEAQSSSIPDSAIRHTVVSLQNTLAIKTLITDFTILNKQLTKEKE